MILEEQVCSLVLAKNLKTLGVKQESYLWWWESTYDNSKIVGSEASLFLWQSKLMHDETHNWIRLLSAFTVAELGEMLSARIKIKEDGKVKILELRMSKGGFSWDEYFLAYEEVTLENPDVEVQRNADTEADARAKMLVYLLENKLITLQ